MRMLSDSLAGGIGADQGSAAAAAPPTATPLSAWTMAARQGQLTTTSSVKAHAGIILSALLCALLGGLCLHILLHCAFHYCGRRRGGSGSGGTRWPAGMKMRSMLRRMPVTVYEAGEVDGGGAPAPAGGAECAICLGEFEDGDAVRLLPRCRHGFHVICIDTWLSAHSSCPICRDSLLDERAVAAAEAASRSFIAAMLFLP